MISVLRGRHRCSGSKEEEHLTVVRRTPDLSPKKRRKELVESREASRAGGQQSSEVKNSPVCVRNHSQHWHTRYKAGVGGETRGRWGQVIKPT